MKLLAWINLYLMFSKEWERVKTKEWFYRLEKSPFQLEKNKFFILFRLTNSILSGKWKSKSALNLKMVKFDKWRELTELPLEDQLVHGVLRQTLDPGVQKKISHKIHSFIKGRSVNTALLQIARKLKKYRKNTPIKERELFVLRFDIQKCGESIPAHPSSTVWKLLSEALPPKETIPNNILSNLLIQCIRPIVKKKNQEGDFQLIYGIPTGSPLQPMILNLYLSQIDEYFDQYCKNEHAIYCRYGDDFLFAHPDYLFFEKAYTGLFDLLKKLELQVSPKKIKSYRWTGSGFQGSNLVEFLGFELKFNGTIRINHAKQIVLNKHLRNVVKKTFHVLKDEPIEKKITTSKKMLEISMGLQMNERHPYFDKLFSLANDRSQLKEFDYQIAYSLAREISGIKHASAFRKVSKKLIYQTYQIPSLLHKRNKKWKP